MSRLIAGTPRQDGYRMPAEFQPHRQTWMLWPERTDNWREGAGPAQRAYAEVAAAISRFEPVVMGANPGQLENARRMLPAGVRLVEMPNNDAWMRDSGPTFVTDQMGNVRGVDWIFNAWGGEYNGLYSPWDKDDRVAAAVLAVESVDRYRAPFVLEGGSIHVDGEGTCLTTAECLLSPGRNPGVTRDQIEEYLSEYLGVEKVLWIPRGVFKDETDGHVDNLCCFIRPGVIALTWTDDPADPQYDRSREAEDYLRTVTDATGRTFEVHRVLQPQPVLITAAEAAGVEPVAGTLPREAGDRMAASYINFYLCNGAAVVPVFGDANDSRALNQLAQLLPDRTIVPVPAREILLGGGNIHCLTQQQPESCILRP